MMWRVVVLIAIVCSAAIGAAPATTQSLSQDVESLIRQLSAQSWKERQRAQDELVKLGVSVRPRLQELVNQAPTDEVRTRAEAALVKIAENEETGTSLVTLHVNDVEPRELFAEISKQIHASLEPAQPQFWEQAHLAKVTLNIDRQPFWTAMKEISEKTGMELVQWNDGMKLVPSGGGGQMRGPSCASGPFFFVANRVNRSESIDLSSLNGPIKNAGDMPQPERDFSVQFTAFAEPKLHILQSSGGAKLDIAVDDKGNSLIPATPDDANQGYTMGVVGTWTVMARLNYPGPQVGTRIKQLKGSVNVVLQTKFEKLEIPSITATKNFEKTLGGIHFIFKSLAPDAKGEHYVLTASALLDHTRPDDYNRAQTIFSSNDLKLLDAKGLAWNIVGRNINGGNNTIDVSIDFSNEGIGPPAPTEPSRLIMQIPTETRELVVPFEFTELPIP